MEKEVLVFTETGAYVLDMGAMTATRSVRKDAIEGTAVALLRKDGEAIQLVSVDHLVVGEPMVLTLAIRDDGVLTERTTTIVQNIIYDELPWKKVGGEA